MAMPTSHDLIQSANDTDLRARVFALADAQGLNRGEVELHMSQMVAAPLNESGDTIASVYAYAVATYEPTPRPGENLSAVTDGQILTALDRTLNGSEGGQATTA